MKRILLAAGAFVLVAATAYAAPTVKTRLVTLPGHGRMPLGACPGEVANVMTDDKGLTLYTYSRDAAGAAKTNCSGECAASWPPFIAAANATPDADWTIVDGTDKDGRAAIKQWAYKGRPVYYHVRDTTPGSVIGAYIGGNPWYVIAQCGHYYLPNAPVACMPAAVLGKGQAELGPDSVLIDITAD